VGAHLKKQGHIANLSTLFVNYTLIDLTINNNHAKYALLLGFTGRKRYFIAVFLRVLLRVSLCQMT